MEHKMLSYPPLAAHRAKSEVMNPFRLKQEAYTSTAFGESPARTTTRSTNALTLISIVYFTSTLVHNSFSTTNSLTRKLFRISVCLSRPSKCVSIQRLKPSESTFAYWSRTAMCQTMPRLVAFPATRWYCHICSFLYPQ